MEEVDHIINEEIRAYQESYENLEISLNHIE